MTAEKPADRIRHDVIQPTTADRVRQLGMTTLASPIELTADEWAAIDAEKDQTRRDAMIAQARRRAAAANFDRRLQARSDARVALEREAQREMVKNFQARSQSSERPVSKNAEIVVEKPAPTTRAERERVAREAYHDRYRNAFQTPAKKEDAE